MLPQIFKNLQDVAVDENGVKPVTIKISYFRNGDILFAQKHTILQKSKLKFYATVLSRLHQNRFAIL